MNIYQISIWYILLALSCTNKKTESVNIVTPIFEFKDSLESLDDKYRITYLIPDTFFRYFDIENYAESNPGGVLLKAYKNSNKNTSKLKLQRPERYFPNLAIKNCSVDPTSLKIKYIIDTIPAMINYFSKEYCITYFILNIPDIETTITSDSIAYGLCFYSNLKYNIYLTIELKDQNKNSSYFRSLFYKISSSINISNKQN